jgi:hypothetical protein
VLPENLKEMMPPKEEYTCPLIPTAIWGWNPTPEHGIGVLIEYIENDVDKGKVS